MEYVSQTIDGAELNTLITLPPILRNKRVQVIVLPATRDDIKAKPNYRCNIGFAKGGEIPDSFFEPLPEEDLQAWGL